MKTLQFFPQWATGPTIETSVSVHNETDRSIEVLIQLYRSDGSLYEERRLTLSARAVQTALLEKSSSFVVGWARLSSDDRFSSNEAIVITEGDRLVTRAGVLPAEVTTQCHLFAFQHGGIRTGLALANVGTSDSAEISVRLIDPAQGLDVTRTYPEVLEIVPKVLFPASAEAEPVLRADIAQPFREAITTRQAVTMRSPPLRAPRAQS